MQKKHLIAVDEFCSIHDVEISYVSSLQQIGLIHFLTIRNAYFIDTENLKLLERYVHFHYVLDINIEGIETISHLLIQLNAMQDEITHLRNRLGLFE